MPATTIELAWVVVTLTVPEESVPEFEADAPREEVAHPDKDIFPTPIRPCGAVYVTTTLCAPVAGLFRCQMLLFCAEFVSETLTTEVIATELYTVPDGGNCGASTWPDACVTRARLLPVQVCETVQVLTVNPFAPLLATSKAIESKYGNPFGDSSSPLTAWNAGILTRETFGIKPLRKLLMYVSESAKTDSHEWQWYKVLPVSGLKKLDSSGRIPTLLPKINSYVLKILCTHDWWDHSIFGLYLFFLVITSNIFKRISRIIYRYAFVYVTVCSTDDDAEYPP